MTSLVAVQKKLEFNARANSKNRPYKRKFNLEAINFYCNFTVQCKTTVTTKPTRCKRMLLAMRARSRPSRQGRLTPLRRPRIVWQRDSKIGVKASDQSTKMKLTGSADRLCSRGLTLPHLSSIPSAPSSRSNAEIETQCLRALLPSQSNCLLMRTPFKLSLQ